MTVRLVQDVTRRRRSPQASTNQTRWTCAFVNNMPNGAFDATERQYLELLNAGSGSEVIEVRRYAMAVVARGERTAARIAEEYSPVFDVYLDPPDLLIVTASKPIETKMRDELYWADLAELLSWGSANVASMWLSCLTAHAAMTIFDGIERVRLPSKCTGVFAQQVDRTHPLALGLEREILLPHTRNNTVPLDALVHSGYRIAIQSDEVGWSVATKEIDGCSVVFVQGHPEYDPSSLLREYRRDARRYVLHERDDLPILPFHCVAPEDWEQLEKMHELIIGGRRDPALLDAYPFDDVGARAPWPWRSMAKRLYANWLASVNKRRDEIDA